MQQIRPLHILIFYHDSQAKPAENLKHQLSTMSVSGVQATVQMADHRTAVPDPVMDGMDLLIVLFTADLERNDHLYQLIRHIEPRAGLERFFVFLDHPAGQPLAFPAIFHTIRAQQHHLYPTPQQLDASASWESIQADLQQDLQTLISRLAAASEEEDQSGQAGIMTRIRKALRGPRALMAAASLVLLIILGWAAFTLVPQFFSSLTPRQILMGAASQPPDMANLWLQESFDRMDLSETWQESNRVKGMNALSVDLAQRQLNITATAPAAHAIYHLESRAQYPLDELQALQISFLLEPLADEGSQAGIDLQAVVVDEPDFFFGCRATPGISQGALSCTIHEPQQEVLVSMPQALSLQELHTLTIQFIPRTYSVRFFLDGRYFGQAAIPSAQFWRGRDFRTHLQVELQDLSTGEFSCQSDDFKLAQQPSTGNP